MNEDINKSFRRAAMSGNPDARDGNSNTPLILAALNGHKAGAKMLLANGADLAARNNNGDTPLIWAEKGGHRNIARMLREGAEGAEQGRPVTRPTPRLPGKGL